MRGKRNLALDVKRKNRRKVRRTILQFAILLMVGGLLYHAVFDTKHYAAANSAEWRNDKGFIAISYFGVGREGTSRLIAKDRLDEQLRALRQQGYETISQQDILDFYLKGKPLPDKALLLAFEDGHADTHLFVQPLLEKYNYKATALTYANKMSSYDNKLLQPKDLLNMQETGYWELGTNGYRLTYINVFDRAGNFWGVRDEDQLPSKGNIATYNHYLMDFIRDSNMIPVEDRAQMEARITADYNQMKEIYTSSLGFVPRLYMIMHANTLYKGMNRLVADVNDANIHQLFAMHFNREGFAYNTRKDNLYDLTRVQPEPYWHTNHLLMKLQEDTQQKMKFVQGAEQQAAQWQLLGGAGEFAGNQIVLTSPPGDNGLLYLNNSSDSRDLQVSTKLEGNVVGEQAIYLRYDRKQGSFVRVVLRDNVLAVEQKKPGNPRVEQLYSAPLNEVKWNPDELIYDRATVYSKAEAVAGGPIEDAGYPESIQNTRKLDMMLQGDKLTVSVDEKVIVNGQTVDSAIASGGVALEASSSEKNKKDNIYDGVFTDVSVTALAKDAAGEGGVLFHNTYTGLEKVWNEIKQVPSAIIDWVMDTF